MTTPTFFTVVADYKTVVADSDVDVDADPQIGPITATVTFRPALRDGELLLASQATPRPTGFAAAPITGRIGSDGRLKLRDSPDGDRINVANVAELPTTGNGNAYYVTTSGTHYRWTSSGYVEIFPYQPIRLLADTPLLELSTPLFYLVSFTNVNFNGRAGKVNSFAFRAPNSDMTLNLISVSKAAGAPASGISRGFGLSDNLSFVNADGRLVLVREDGVNLDPVDVPAPAIVAYAMTFGR